MQRPRGRPCRVWEDRRPPSPGHQDGGLGVKGKKTERSHWEQLSFRFCRGSLKTFRSPRFGDIKVKTLGLWRPGSGKFRPGAVCPSQVSSPMGVTGKKRSSHPSWTEEPEMGGLSTPPAPGSQNKPARLRRPPQMVKL